MNMVKRTWAEISLNAIEHNYNVIRNKVADDTKVCCVIKADGYGQVLERCARTYPVAKPAEGHGVVGLLVCPQLLVVLLGAVGIGQVGWVFDLGVGVAGGDEYRNAYGHQQYFEQIFHCL